MRLSPLDIQHMEFQRGAGGYQRRQVREFLERVAHEVEDMLREMQEQNAELERRAEKIATLQTAEAELQRAIIAAERIGNEIKLNARKEADLIVQEAETLKTGRLQTVDMRLREARGEIARLEREHALFRDQFRGMLDAYARSLENQPRLGETFAIREGSRVAPTVAGDGQAETKEARVAPDNDAPENDVPEATAKA